MFATIVLVFLSTSPLLISSLQCNVCREPIRVNYIVTKSNVPALPSNCTVIEASVCWASIFWELDLNRTQLEFRARPGPPDPNVTARDMVSVRIIKAMGQDNKTLESAREVNFECQSSNGCNGQAGIEKVLGALTIQDELPQKVVSLFQIIRPFNPREAGCVYFHNATVRCPAPDFQHCHRCSILPIIDPVSNASSFCATCPDDPINDNSFERYANFVINNRTEDFFTNGDFYCQVHGCNSPENAMSLLKATEIQFNNEEYFK